MLCLTSFLCLPFKKWNWSAFTKSYPSSLTKYGSGSVDQASIHLSIPCTSVQAKQQASQFLLVKATASQFPPCRCAVRWRDSGTKPVCFASEVLWKICQSQVGHTLKNNLHQIFSSSLARGSCDMHVLNYRHFPARVERQLSACSSHTCHFRSTSDLHFSPGLVFSKCNFLAQKLRRTRSEGKGRLGVLGKGRRSGVCVESGLLSRVL